jgi:hypothetical protein
MAMSFVRAGALVVEMKQAISIRRFDLAARAYKKLARANSTFPPVPSKSSDADVWGLLQRRAQERVDRQRIEAEQAELLRCSRYRSLVAITY